MGDGGFDGFGFLAEEGVAGGGEFLVARLRQGGGKLVNTSVGGKSFSFSLPASMSSDALMIACDRALRQWDSLDATQRALLFTTRKQSTVRASF